MSEIIIRNESENKELNERIVDVLRTVYDPEIPVDIYELGLVYELDINKNFDVTVTMTLTAPNCPAADQIVSDVEDRVKSIKEINACAVNIVYDPPWSQEMMSEVARLQLGFM